MLDEKWKRYSQHGKEHVGNQFSPVVCENLRKFIVYVFAHNWAELVPYVLFAVLGIPLPLLVQQVLAIDLGLDVIPSLALSREPPEAGIMEERPRGIKERLFSTGVFFRSLYIGVIIATGAMIGCFMAWQAGGWHLGMSQGPSNIAYVKGTTRTFTGIVIGKWATCSRPEPAKHQYSARA